MKLYTATWCSKCKMIKPFLSPKVQIVDVTNWTDDQVRELGLKGLPTLQDDGGVLYPINSVKDLEKYGAKK